MNQKLIAITGATGFVGKSLFSQIARLKQAGHDSNKYELIVRSKDVAQHTLDISNEVEWVHFTECDVLEKVSFSRPVDTVFHFAVPASAQITQQNPDLMFDLNVRGLSNLLIELNNQSTSVPDVVLASSGAVYGEMPAGIERFTEDFKPRVDEMNLDAYARGKIEAEQMLKDATNQGICRGLVARLFAFSGVHLPLDRHFAIGNFVRDAVSTQRIIIRGDGTAIRSYLDGQDMAEWLLCIAEKGSSDYIYHVGSEHAISILELAHRVASRYEALFNQPVQVEVLGKKSNLDGVSRYVPSTQFTRNQLGLSETISLDQSIDNMLIKAKTRN